MNAHDDRELEGTGAQRLIIVDADAQQQARVAQILGPLTPEILLYRSLDELPPDLDGDLLIVNYDALEGDRSTLANNLSGLRRGAPLLVLSAGRCRDDFVSLFGNHSLTNLLARNGEVDADELIVTAQKLLRRDVFGIEKYFARGVEPVSITALCSSDKERILCEAEAFVRELRIRARFAEHFCSVADELVTNALYNAPVDSLGRRRYAHLSRATEVVLGQGEGVLVQFCCDGRRLGIATVDPFGSLTEQIVLDYLAKCFRKGADQVDRKQGGAGLGLYYVFEALSHFVVNISTGNRTEMIGVIDIRGTYRDFAARCKSFNIFTGN